MSGKWRILQDYQPTAVRAANNNPSDAFWYAMSDLDPGRQLTRLVELCSDVTWCRSVIRYSTAMRASIVNLIVDVVCEWRADPHLVANRLNQRAGKHVTEFVLNLSFGTFFYDDGEEISVDVNRPILHLLCVSNCLGRMREALVRFSVRHFTRIFDSVIAEDAEFDIRHFVPVHFCRGRDELLSNVIAYEPACAVRLALARRRGLISENDFTMMTRIADALM
jgi:hypothetical protein